MPMPDMFTVNLIKFYVTGYYKVFFKIKYVKQGEKN
jgi:hypothetical protein